jgi:hypothetical protein
MNKILNLSFLFLVLLGARVASAQTSTLILDNPAYNHVIVEVRVGNNADVNQNPTYPGSPFTMSKGNPLTITTQGQDVFYRREGNPDSPNGSWTNWTHVSLAPGQQKRMNL